MLVKDFMKRNILFAHPDDNIRDAAKLMARYGVGSVLVMSSNKELVGIITERDITREVAKAKNLDKLLVKNVMSKNVVFIKEDNTLEDAADLMIDNDIKKLPIEDKKGNLIGIITSSDIILADFKFVKVFKSMFEAKNKDELDSYKYKFFESDI